MMNERNEMMNERDKMMNEVKDNRQRIELNEMELEGVAGGSLWKKIKRAAKDLGEGIKSLF